MSSRKTAAIALILVLCWSLYSIPSALAQDGRQLAFASSHSGTDSDMAQAASAPARAAKGTPAGHLGRRPLAALSSRARSRGATGPSARFDIGVISMGLGVTALAVGMTFRSDAQQASAGLARRIDPRLHEDANRARDRMTLAFSLGTAAVVTGGVLVYLGLTDAPRSSDCDRLLVAPSIGPDGVGVRAQGRF